MFCPKCGAENNETAKYCASCGQPMEVAGPSPVPPPAAPMGVGPAPAPMQKVPNYLVHAILVAVLCCVPCGVVGIVFASQVNAKLQAGDYRGAVEASTKAKMWTTIGFVVGLVLGILMLIGVLLGEEEMAGAGL